MRRSLFLSKTFSIALLLVAAPCLAERASSRVNLGDVVPTTRDKQNSGIRQGTLLDHSILKTRFLEPELQKRGRLAGSVHVGTPDERARRWRELQLTDDQLAEYRAKMARKQTYADHGALLTDQQVRLILENILAGKEKLQSGRAKQLREWRIDRLAHLDFLKRNGHHDQYVKQADNLNILFPIFGRVFPEFGTKPYDTPSLRASAWRLRDALADGARAN